MSIIKFYMDYIKFKIVIRGFVSSIVPFWTYTIGYLLYRQGIFDNLGLPKDVPYLNPVALATWIILTQLYPFYLINLWFIFAPIENYFNKKLWIDPSTVYT